MKGEGLGTFLPAMQANSSEAHGQIHQILVELHTLRCLIMPKCLSKFEHDICDFSMNYNNIFSFGSLEPNGTSIQLNVSSVGKLLDSTIGTQQGSWHTNKSDDPQFWTMFTLLFCLPAGMNNQCNRKLSYLKHGQMQTLALFLLHKVDYMFKN